MPKMTGSRFFAEAMQSYGVTHVFFVPTIMLPALAEMEDMNIRRVMTHGEKAAAYMADGYARALRKPGICMAQTVGAANLAAGLRDAYLGGSPVIAITGGRQPATTYRHVYQEIEDFPIFNSVTKFNAQVDTVERLLDLLRQAFRAATTGAPGPVHLEMRGSHGHVVEEEGDLELIVEAPFLRYPAFPPEPEGERVGEAARVLTAAQRPVIVAGGGVAASQAAPEVVELAERLSIPVATSLNAKGTIPDDHPLSVGVIGTYSRWCANRVVAEADLVFFISSHTGSQITNNWRIPAIGTPVIQLDIDPLELGRNYPNTVSLLGDAKVTLRRLLEVRKPMSPKADWLQRVQEHVSGWRAEVAAQRDSDAIPMRPERICKVWYLIDDKEGVMDTDMTSPGFERIVLEPATLDRIAYGLQFGEGPVWNARHSYLLWVDIVGDTVWKWTPGKGTEIVLRPSGKANGTTYDRQGRLVVAGWASRTVPPAGATCTAYAIPDARDGCCFQRRTKDLEARKQLIFDIQRYAAEQQYYVYTNSNMLTGSWQPYVKNFAPNMSFGYGNRAAALWLDR